jgi:hypothetical protein
MNCFGRVGAKLELVLRAGLGVEILSSLDPPAAPPILDPRPNPDSLAYQGTKVHWLVHRRICPGTSGN